MLCWSAKVVRVSRSVCDVWSPRATNGVGESPGHYVQGVRALETLPSNSLFLSLLFLSTARLQQTQRHHNGSGEIRAQSVQVRRTTVYESKEGRREMWALGLRTHMHIVHAPLHQETLSTSFIYKQLQEIKPGCSMCSLWPLHKIIDRVTDNIVQLPSAPALYSASSATMFICSSYQWPALCDTGNNALHKKLLQ